MCAGYRQWSMLYYFYKDCLPLVFRELNSIFPKTFKIISFCNISPHQNILIIALGVQIPNMLLLSHLQIL